jgi:hypothetical protein
MRNTGLRQALSQVSRLRLAFLHNCGERLSPFSISLLFRGLIVNASHLAHRGHAYYGGMFG